MSSLSTIFKKYVEVWTAGCAKHPSIIQVRVEPILAVSESEAGTGRLCICLVGWLVAPPTKPGFGHPA